MHKAVLIEMCLFLMSIFGCANRLSTRLYNDNERVNKLDIIVIIPVNMRK